jgi:hypothetical protein
MRSAHSDGRACASMRAFAFVCVSARCERARARVVVMTGLHLSVGEADQALTSTVRVRATWYLRDDEVLAWCIRYLGTRSCNTDLYIRCYNLRAQVRLRRAAVGATKSMVRRRWKSATE